MSAQKPSASAVSFKAFAAASNPIPTMLRATSILLGTGFLAASGKAMESLTSNGDTGAIVLQTVVCVVLLTVALYCRHLRESRLE